MPDHAENHSMVQFIYYIWVNLYTASTHWMGYCTPAESELFENDLFNLQEKNPFSTQSWRKTWSTGQPMGVNLHQIFPHGDLPSVKLGALFMNQARFVSKFHLTSLQPARTAVTKWIVPITWNGVFIGTEVVVWIFGYPSRLMRKSRCSNSKFHDSVAEECHKPEYKLHQVTRLVFALLKSNVDFPALNIEEFWTIKGIAAVEIPLDLARDRIVPEGSRWSSSKNFLPRSITGLHSFCGKEPGNGLKNLR